MKKLKNIEGKNEKQLKAIDNHFFSTISEKAKILMNNIKQTDDWLESAQLICTKTDGKTKYDFNKLTFPLKFTSKIYRRDLTLQKAEDNQQKLKILINKLNNNYNPKNKIKIKEKSDTLESAKILYSIKEDIINAFKKSIFTYIDGFQAEKDTDEDTDEDTDGDKDEEMNTTIMTELGSEESAAERRDIQGKGIKILTPNQMLSRLPISLAQLQAGNNSGKLKNEVRQLLYSLYRLKNMTKQVYNNIINPI